ncbi:MAG TPA: rhodanese-like domain-containing protein [Pseudolabrys sp.]|nr:rhodanese-like domain-containing protein [Pseudolabrys sp.]
MSKVRTILAAATLALLVPFGISSHAGFVARAEAATALPGPLVTPQWLNDHLKDVVVIDVRDNAKQLTTEPKFTAAKDGTRTLAETGGHIPGALFVDFNKIREARTVDGMKLNAMMPTKEFFEKAMDAAGLDKGSTIVIAAVGNGIESLDMATRLFFQLKYFGEDKIAVLNGGTNGWIAGGFPVSVEAIPAKTGNWVATAERKDILATTDDVKKAVRGGRTQLVDSRPTAQFFGLAKSPVVLAAGHVQGARSFPTEAASRPVGIASEFMDADAYRAVFKQQGIDPGRPLISYCNTGHLASGGWFVAHEILKNKDAKLYSGSMNEWTHLKNPVVGLP